MVVRVALVGKWHVHAPAYGENINRNPKAKIVAVWDDDVERGQAWADQYGVPFFTDLDELFAKVEVDAIMVCSATTKHYELIMKAAKAKKHIFTEKCLAPTMKECRELKAAIEENGVKFVIAYHMVCEGFFKYAKQKIEEGAFGQLCSVRIRNGHDGVSAGWLPKYWFNKDESAGGSMMDLGCHPMYTLPYLCGKPKRVSAIFTEQGGSGLDENAVCSVEFENGVIGIAETSFMVAGRTPEIYEVYGTKGSITNVGGNIQMRSYITGDGHLYTPDDIPANDMGHLETFVECCAEDLPVPRKLGIDAALELTQLLEASYIADETNKTVIIED